MSKSLSYSSVPRAIEQALAQGYRFSPAAVKLLVRLGEQRKTRKSSQESEPTFEMIVREVIEVKVKKTMGSGQATIEVNDLIETFPLVFEFE